MAGILCPIWGTEAQLLREVGDSAYYDSPRAGGRFGISGTAIAMLQTWQDNDKANLTTWLCDQRRAGIAMPEIHSGTLEAAKSSQPLSTSERIERAILYFGMMRFGQTLATSRTSDWEHRDIHFMVLAAHTACVAKPELLSLLTLLVEMELLNDHSPADFAHQFAPSAKGWLKIEELARKLPSTTQAFVAMWFNDATQAAYENGIKLGIEDAGSRCRLIHTEAAEAHGSNSPVATRNAMLRSTPTLTPCYCSLVGGERANEAQGA